MKKTFLFFTVFLFFAFLSAEEVKNEPAESQPQSENAQKTDSEAACSCDDSNKNNEKPNFFYFQPAIGFGMGMSAYRPTVGLNADFLVSHTEQINYYVGLDLDFKVSFLTYDCAKLPMGFAIQANGVFDFMVNNSELRSVGLWIALGLNLVSEYDAIGDGVFEETRSLSYSATYGIGLDFVFENYVILKVGLDSFLFWFPDLTILVGYRF